MNQVDLRGEKYCLSVTWVSSERVETSLVSRYYLNQGVKQRLMGWCHAGGSVSLSAPFEVASQRIKILKIRLQGWKEDEILRGIG